MWRQLTLGLISVIVLLWGFEPYFSRLAIFRVPGNEVANVGMKTEPCCSFAFKRIVIFRNPINNVSLPSGQRPIWAGRFSQSALRWTQSLAAWRIVFWTVDRKIRWQRPGNDLKGRHGSEFISWRLTSIFNFTMNGDSAFAHFWLGKNKVHRRRIHNNIGSQFPLSHISGYPKGFPREIQRVNQKAGAEGRNTYLPPCGAYLPFSGFSAFPSGISSFALGSQIVGLMLLGFLFAIPGSLGLYWVFDDPNRNRKFVGGTLAVLFFTCTVFFYGWAISAHPFATWGLC